MTNVDFTEQEFKDIQKESHQFHQTYIEQMESNEEKENMLEEQSAGLFATFLTSVGVVAGFGFAALGNVANIKTFFLAEILLLGLIVFGLYLLYAYNKSRKKQLDKIGENTESLLGPRLTLYQEFLTRKISKKELYEKLNADDQRVFGFKFKFKASRILELDKYFIPAIIILIIGMMLLLLSFVRGQKNDKELPYHNTSGFQTELHHKNSLYD